MNRPKSLSSMKASKTFDSKNFDSKNFDSKNFDSKNFDSKNFDSKKNKTISELLITMIFYSTFFLVLTLGC